VICSQSVIDKRVNEKLGLDRIKPGGAWSSIIEAGTGHILAGPLLPDEEGIVYADIDLNKIVSHYFLHETTGHYWPKQFQVTFDAREIKPLTINRSKDLSDAKTEMEKGEAEAEKYSDEIS
jgi:hypothetical protein